MRVAPTDARCDGWPLAVCVEPPRDEMNCPVWQLMEHHGYDLAAAALLGYDVDDGGLGGDPFDPVRFHAITDKAWELRTAREANVCALRPPWE